MSFMSHLFAALDLPTGMEKMIHADVCTRVMRVRHVASCNNEHSHCLTASKQDGPLPLRTSAVIVNIDR